MPARLLASFQAFVLNPVLIAALALGGPKPGFAQDEAPAKPRPAKPASKSGSAAKSREPITLNFVNAEIDAVSRAMAVILDRQIIVDPRVKGTVTLYSEVPLAPSEAYLNYLSALRGLGFAMVEVNGLLKVVPEADAKLQTGTVSVGGVGRKGDQILTQIFRLQHENANNMVTVLRPLITPNNTINANPTNNTLVITDYADNLQRIAKMIAAMDIPAATDVEVIPVQHASAADLLPMVQKLVDTSANTPGVAPGAGGMSLMADARTNSILVRAPNPSRLAMVRSMVAKLDRPMQGTGVGGGNIYVIYLKNADAVKLAQVLRAAYGGSGGSGGSSGGSGTSQPSQTQAAQGNSSGGASPQATAPVQASAGPSTGGFVQADPATNSLIITAPEPLYRQMRSVIDQLDSRRAQVYIESMIVEVTADNNGEFGFQWQGIHDGKAGLVGTNLPIGGVPGILDLAAKYAADSLTSIGNGINVGVIKSIGGGVSLAALAHALQTQSKTNIMSTPNLVTLDNEEAKIVVGDNVPFITGQFTGSSGANANPFQTIERKDVGLTLRIKPQIGEAGTVRMTIFQESSDVKDQAKGTDNAGPTTSKRSIESTVVVDDGQIIVLGGLIQDRFTNNMSKVPLLGDIPFVGHLFRSESRSKARTNLMVFIRPTVMRDSDTAGKLSQDRYDAIRAQQQDTQPPKHLLIPVDEIPVLDPSPTRALPPRVSPAASDPAR